MEIIQTETNSTIRSYKLQIAEVIRILADKLNISNPSFVEWNVDLKELVIKSDSKIENQTRENIAV
jgi:hypothetical protein